jgi:glucose/arabinose dehydrogenase
MIFLTLIKKIMKPILTTILFCLYLQNVVSQTTNAINIVSFATGFSKPVEITHAKDTRLFVVQQGGLIRILNSNGTKNATPFLNISSLVSTTGSEQGLLGLAFHPNYKANGFFYVNYTNAAGNTVIAKYSVSTSDSNIANPTGSIIMTIKQPFDNHNGGTIKFGSDGYLYIGMGDGGSGGDPGNRAQNLDTLLGKMLRINIDTTAAYKIPATNPYVGIAGADEIWASGLRNPWKFSFDRQTSDLWIADVGQDTYEEIDKAAITQSGLNYGWRCYEGNSTFNTNGCGAIGLYKPALVAINQTTGACSITGGYVYRGTAFPNLFGKYLFSDLCRPRIGLVDTSGNVTFSSSNSGKAFTTFGEDVSGELYIADYTLGEIFKIAEGPLSIDNVSLSKFKIFPNPMSGILTIKSEIQTYLTEFLISDLKGSLLLSNKPSNTLENKIDVSALSKGIYRLTIVDNNKAISNYKLVVE